MVVGEVATQGAGQFTRPGQAKADVGGDTTCALRPVVAAEGRFPLIAGEDKSVATFGLGLTVHGCRPYVGGGTMRLCNEMEVSPCSRNARSPSLA